MSIGIDFILRASTNGFTRGLASAENSLKDLKKGLKEFNVGGGLGQLLGVGGVIQGFRATINHAQELRDALKEAGKPIDESIQRVARYGDAIDGIKGKIGELAIETISFFNKAGEGWGTLINDIRGVSREQVKTAEEGEANAKKQQDAMYKMRQEQEKLIPSLEKQIAAQDKANSESSLSRFQKLNTLIKERSDLLQKIANMGDAPILKASKLQAQLEASKLTGRIQELQKDEKKDVEDFDKEKLEQKKKLIEKFAPTVEQLAEKNVGGFAAKDNPVLKARQALQAEERARMLFDRGDIKGGLSLALKAQGLRDSLSFRTSESGVLTPKAAEEAVSKALESTNTKLDELQTAVKGIIKAQK